MAVYKVVEVGMPNINNHWITVGDGTYNDKAQYTSNTPEDAGEKFYRNMMLIFDLPMEVVYISDNVYLVGVSVCEKYPNGIFLGYCKVTKIME